ncbi:sulfatase-like hydrolase/transferase [Echinicola sp. 20G]|uniref:sulfatase-like hydrolase/transferase n=1 Tax=Echinicola sp. 20G TaxID=2781961 RepID=UPI00191012B5|nr:sulfatase-like hydrolase/transferase [Echinicola sp. 20G]
MRTLLLLLFLCFTLKSQAFQTSNDRRPNIILIMADDLGFETLGINGSESYETPHLDMMAKAGMNFTQCYSMPLCTPSRVQLMTGKYNIRNYIGFGLLDPNEQTFGDYLKEAGYDNFIAGKWQLYGNNHQRQLAGNREGSLPEETGFEDYCLWQVKQLGSRYKDPLLSSPEGDKVYEGEFGPDIFVDQIIDFIGQERQNPFFVYFPMALTHDPFVPTPDNPSFSTYDAKSKTNDPQYFKEMVHYMDKLIGKIISAVNQNAENTLVIFIGDNGTDHDVTSVQNGLKVTGDKGHTTLAGTHVPMIAYWKDKIKADQVNQNLIDFTDFVPTLLDVSGYKKSERPFTDGISFYPQLLNQKAQERQWVYCYYDPNWGNFEKSIFVHDQKWKLYENGSIYNLQEDPLEKAPLDKSSLNKKTLRKITTFQKVLDQFTTAESH